MAESRLREPFRGALNVALLVFWVTRPEQALAHPDPNESPRLQAIPVTSPIEVDGRLDEPAWQQAEVARGFRQREPEPFAAATEETEVRVVYSQDTLYIGVNALDSRPSRIVARELGRDVLLSRDDSVVVLLDTFHDHRNAYFFETNPLGLGANGLRASRLPVQPGPQGNRKAFARILRRVAVYPAAMWQLLRSLRSFLLGKGPGDVLPD